MSDKNHRRPPQGGGGGGRGGAAGGAGGGAGAAGGGGRPGFWKGLANFAQDFKEQGVLQKFSASTKEVWLNPIKEIAKDISADVKEALRPGGASDAHAALRAAAHDKRKPKETSQSQHLQLASAASGGSSSHARTPGGGGSGGGGVGGGTPSIGAAGGSSSKPGGGGGGGGGGPKGQAGKQLDSIFASLDPADDVEEEVVTGGLNEGRGHKRHGYGHDHEGTTTVDMMTEAADSLKNDLSVTAAFEKIKAMRVGGSGGGGGGGSSSGGAGGGGGGGGGVGALLSSVSRWEPVPVPEPVRRVAAAAVNAVRGQLAIAAVAAAVLMLIIGVVAWEQTSAAAVQQKGAEAHAATHAAVHPEPLPELGVSGVLGPAPAPAPAASGDYKTEEAGGFKEGPPAPAVAALGQAMTAAVEAGAAAGAAEAGAAVEAGAAAGAVAGAGAEGAGGAGGLEGAPTKPPAVASLGRKFLSHRGG
jgi:hypothetical protein